jgi:DNA-binding MarR family transcriptional regulator
MRSDAQAAEITAELIAEECVAVRLRLLTRAVSRIYNNLLRPHGLTVSQMNILVAVSCLGKARPQQICHVLHLEKSSLSRDLERMRQRGWLANLAGEDGRTSLLKVTPNGRKLLQKATPSWQQAQRQATALLGEKDIAGLHRAAKTLNLAKAKGLI